MGLRPPGQPRQSRRLAVGEAAEQLMRNEQAFIAGGPGTEPGSRASCGKEEASWPCACSERWRSLS
jgi:hypothetical protein